MCVYTRVGERERQLWQSSSIDGQEETFLRALCFFSTIGSFARLRFPSWESTAHYLRIYIYTLLRALVSPYRARARALFCAFNLLTPPHICKIRLYSRLLDKKILFSLSLGCRKRKKKTYRRRTSERFFLFFFRKSETRTGVVCLAIRSTRAIHHEKTMNARKLPYTL